jgi:hypothetical protein
MCQKSGLLSDAFHRSRYVNASKIYKKQCARGVPFRNQTWRTAEKVAFSDVTLTPWHELGTLNGSRPAFQIPVICVAALQQLLTYADCQTNQQCGKRKHWYTDRPYCNYFQNQLSFIPPRATETIWHKQGINTKHMSQTEFKLSRSQL